MVWSPSIKKHYESFGYVWTGQGTKFEVNVEHLQKGSKVYVDVECDYCGEVLQKIYYKYIRGREIVEKDSCNSCRGKKTKETNMIIYGVENINQVKEKAEKGSSKRRTSFDFVKQKFIEKGYILISDRFKGVHYKLEYRCKKHFDKGIQTITFHNLNRHDSGCCHCGIEKMSGENAPNWRGGTTEIRFYLRGKLNEWKKKSLKSCNYRCVVTGKNVNNLEIHHLYPFEKIYRESLNELGLDVRPKVRDYSDQELNLIEKLVMRKHNKLLGVPLLPEIHNLFHSTYGRVDSIPEQFYKFKERYLNGEFEIELIS